MPPDNRSSVPLSDAASPAAPFLAAIRDSMRDGIDAYQSAVLIYADWLEERDGGEGEECQRLRRLAVHDVLVWAAAREILLTECELIEGVAWMVWREDGLERTLKTRRVFFGYDDVFDSQVTAVFGFSPAPQISQPCEGEYIGAAEFIGRIRDIAERERRHVVLGENIGPPKGEHINRDGWLIEQAAPFVPPLQLSGEGVQSLIFSCEGDPPRVTAVRAKKKEPPALPARWLEEMAEEYCERLETERRSIPD